MAYKSMMSSGIAQAEINRQLEELVVDLEEAFSRENLNIFSVTHGGGVTGLFARPDLTARLRAPLAGLTMANWLDGAITSIDLTKIDRTGPIEVTSPEETARRHPLCDADALIDQMKALNEPHLRWCLQGDVNRAARAATTTLALEDIGCTLAAMGQFDPAISFIDAASIGDRLIARMHVRCVVLLEKCRRRHPGFTEDIEMARLQGDGRLNVVLALSGRLPWMGYPYSDW